MRKDIKILENKKINQKKRKNQIKFNYIDNYDEIQKMKFDEIKNIYSNRIDEFEKSKLSYNKENELYLFEFKNLKILLRDNSEKRFFLNSFIDEYIEYNQNQKEKKEDEIDFKKFLIDISNFLIFKDKNIIILDIEKDYI